MDNEEITVSGIIFSHGTNGEYEFYFHTDHRGILWQAWRHLREQGQTRWYASVHQPGPGGVDAILNSFIHHQEAGTTVECRTDAGGDREPSVLLCGLAGLISSGELPRYESYQAIVIAPVIDSVDEEATTVVFYVECIGCRQFYGLKVELADYDRLSNRTEFIQNIFPYLSPPMRELLISGTCPKCWKKMFGAEDTSTDTQGAL
ncbi:MAG TPA: hypothetical protein VJ464_23675 [Blastocatellia bacterium]|nr:hypothetical protein [Blastocatellia bacterium]